MCLRFDHETSEVCREALRAAGGELTVHKLVTVNPYQRSVRSPFFPFEWTPGWNRASTRSATGRPRGGFHVFFGGPPSEDLLDAFAKPGESPAYVAGMRARLEDFAGAGAGLPFEAVFRRLYLAPELYRMLLAMSRLPVVSEEVRLEMAWGLTDRHRADVAILEGARASRQRELDARAHDARLQPTSGRAIRSWSPGELLFFPLKRRLRPDPPLDAA